ncbi:MAG: response regulator transcription factor [Hoeflea sp.]|uniref:response regulator transcription factor n=1 Tax=Hoeflea sp. TaxID=1940281 RepID=UPI0032EBB672
MRILLVEDNTELATMLADRFSAQGDAVDVEGDGAGADQLLAHSKFDIVILDVNLPNKDGYSILQSMRERKDSTPVLMLTARSEIDDRVTGLDSGADDYVVKPIEFRELAARCRALVRRRTGQAANVFRHGNFLFDRSAKRAFVDEIDLNLRNRDVQLLEAFLGNLDRVIAKEDVADKIYSFEETPSLNAVEQAVTRLRKKLEGSPIIIRTVRGLGYIANAREQ